MKNFLKEKVLPSFLKLIKEPSFWGVSLILSLFVLMFYGIGVATNVSKGMAERDRARSLRDDCPAGYTKTDTEYCTDQQARFEKFQYCLQNVPKGPTTTMSNDWNEVVKTCGEQATMMSSIMMPPAKNPLIQK